MSPSDNSLGKRESFDISNEFFDKYSSVEQFFNLKNYSLVS